MHYFVTVCDCAIICIGRRRPYGKACRVVRMSQIIVISWMTLLCADKMTTHSVGLAHCRFPSVVCLHLLYELLIMYNPFISYLSGSSYWCYCWRRGWRNSTDLSDPCWSYYICCCLLTKTKTEIYNQQNCDMDNTVMLYASVL